MSLISETAAATALNLRSLPQRLGASLVTVIGVATTVAVMISLLAIGAGLLKTSARDIDPNEVIVLPSGAQSEYAGSLSRDAVAQIAQAPGLAHTADGRAILQPQALTIVEVTKKAGGDTTNIALRGTGPMGRLVNPSVHLIQGRLFRPAVHELIVGKVAQKQFRDMDVGDTIRLRSVDWTVVGVFEANGGIVENQMFADADTVMAAFDRTAYQSVEGRLESPAAFGRFKDALTSNPQLNVDVKFFSDYVAGQLKQLTTVLNFVGYFVGGVMAIGAIISALNTMYSAVDARAREIATLRAIGFGGAS